MSSDPQPSQPIQKKDQSDLVLGVFALIGGSALSYVFIISPLIAAAKHQASVDISLKAIVVTPVILAIGIINVVMGEKARPIIGRKRMPSPVGWAIYIVTFGIGVLLYLWMKSRLRDYGYQI